MERAVRTALGVAGALAVLLPSSLPAQTGQISGRVTGELSDPVGGVPVELYRPWGEHLATTGSDPATGEYVLAGLDDGTYLVRVPSVPGLDLVGEYFQDVNEHDQDLATPVEVVAGGSVSGVDFELAPAGSIAGTVFGLAADESVQLQLFDAYNGRYRGASGSDPATGAFALEGLATGSFYLFTDSSGTDRALRWWDGATVQSGAETISVGRDEDVIGKDVTLEPGTSISGTVVLSPDPGDGGTTLERMGVGVVDAATHEWVHYRQIPADGVYEIPNLPPGTYVVEAHTHDTGYVREVWVPGADLPGQDPVFQYHEGEPVSVDVGTLASGIDFLLEEGRWISGRVFLESVAVNGVQDPGEPGLEQVSVSAERADGTWVNGTGTGSVGDFVLTGLSPGRYRVRVESSEVDLPFVAEVWQDRAFWEPGDLVDVSVGDAAEIDFGVVQDRVISGRVFLDFDDDQVQDADEPGFQNVDVRAYDAATGQHVGHAAVAPDGRWSIGVRSGTYLLEATPHQGTLLREHWRDVFFQDQAEPIDVRSADAAGIDFGLVDGAIYGTLHGRVLDADTDTGIAGVQVRVERFETGSWVGQTATAEDGSFALSSVPPGSYQVHFGTRSSNAAHDTDYVGSYWSSTGVAGDPDPAARRVDYPTTPGVGTDLGAFGLEPGGSVSGRLYAPFGESLPLPFDVFARDPDGDGSTDSYASVAADGAYHLRGVSTSSPVHVASAWGTDFAQVYYVSSAESTFDPEAATLLQLTPGVEIPGIDLHLVRGGAISGRITRESDGSAVAGYPVQPHRLADESGGELWLPWESTDSDGFYRLPGLPSGDYEVVTRGTGSLANEVYPSPVSVTAPDEASGIDFALAEGISISGVVFLDLDGDGLRGVGEPAVAGASVHAWKADGPLDNWSQTAADGTYSVGGLASGRYFVEADGRGTLLHEYWPDALFQDGAGVVDATAGSVSGIDFSLIDGASVGPLRGRVTGSGGVPGVEVQVYRYEDDAYVAGTTTDSLGDFSFPHLPPAPAGGYKVWFDTSRTNAGHDTDFVSSYWAADGTPGVIDPELLRVEFPEVPGDGTDLGTFTLDHGGSISGTVHPPPGSPLPAGLWVGAASAESGGADPPGVPVAADGSYRIRGIPAPATYRVSVDTRGTDLVPVFYWSATESTFDHDTATAVQVGVGADTGGIDLFPYAGGGISGTVTRAADGTPVAGFPVYAYLVDDPLARQFWGGHTQTGADGAFTFRGLPGGSYVVRTDGRAPDLANQTYPQTVPVTEGTVTGGVHFALEPAGRITGTVTRADTGEPVVGIRVEAADYDTGEWLSDAYTAADGTYSILGLAQGRDYRLQVHTQDGPDPQFFNFVAAYYDGRLTWDAADPVRVPVDPGGGGVTVSGIDFALDLGGTVTGVVRAEATGEPLSGIWVWAEDHGGSGFGNGDHTDHNGLYVIRGLAAGSYRLSVNPFPQPYAHELFDDTRDWSRATPVTVLPVPDGGPIPVTDHVDFDLAPAFRITGRVTEVGSGAPVPGLVVRAGGDDLAFWPESRTDADGSYELLGLPDGRFDVTVETEGTGYARQQRTVEVAGADLTGVDFLLERGAGILGRVWVDDLVANGVYDPGEGRPDVYVQADDFADGWFAAGATTGADGLYELDGLGAGSYRVALQSGADDLVPMLWDGAFRWDDAIPVEVPADGAGVPQDVTGIDFQALQGFAIRGLVFYDADGDGLRGPGEPPVSNAQPRGQTTDGFFFLGAGTQADGTYVLHGAHPGTWTFWVEAQGTPFAGEVYRVEGGAPVGTWRWSEGDRVTVAGDVTGVDFSLGLGGGITGTVRNAETGEPLAGINVNVNDFDGDGLWGWDRTGPDGTYLADGLPPGRYRVEAWDDAGDYVFETHHQAYFWEDASPVSVSARSALTDPLATPVDFDLDRAGAVEGVVYGDANGDGAYQTGEPLLAGVHVGAEEAEPPHRWLFGVDTALDGSYRLGGLPPDVPLRIVARPRFTDHVAAYWDGGDDRGALHGADALPVPLTAGGVTGDIRFGLAAGGSIAGRVLDGDGAPVPGLWVNANPLEPGLPGNGAETGLDGRYVVHGLTAGSYRVDTGGGDLAYELYDGRSDWRLADPVAVAVGSVTSAIDFVLPRVPRIVSGPEPPEGRRGSTVSGVTLVIEGLHGPLCAAVLQPPCMRVELGTGVSVADAVLDAATGTLTFDLAIAADAPLGRRTLSLVADQVLEDAAALLRDGFEVLPALGGDEPAPSGERVYVTDSGASRLRVYGAADLSLLGTVETCANPGAVELSSGGAFAFVACGDRSLSVIDTRLGTVGEEVARTLLMGSFGSRSLAATDRFLYSIDRETGTPRIQVVDLATWQSVADVALPATPWSVALDPAGTTLYAALRGIGQVARVDLTQAPPAVSTVSLGAGAAPWGIAFTPDGSRVLVLGQSTLFVLSADGVLLDTLSTFGSWGGLLDVAHHPASGKDLAYVRSGGSIWVVDVTPGVAPAVLRSMEAGTTLSAVRATADRLYASYLESLDLYVLDTADLLTSASLGLIRFDGWEGTDGIATPGEGLAVGPALARATAPPLQVLSGSPAVNGAPITLTVSGDGFAPDALVALQGTHVRGTVTSATASELAVELPAHSPAGEHLVVVTNPAPGGGESRLSATPLVVEPPAEYAPTQIFYLASYGSGRVVAVEPGSEPRDMVTQPYSARVTLSPDGRRGLVNQFYGSPWAGGDELPESYLDVTILDLDRDSPTYGEVVATVPWVWTWFSRPAVTPSADDPDGVLAYAPNLYMSDTVSVIDPELGIEVDLDGDPGTQSIPLNDPYTWIYGEKLPGITRIELDEQVTDRSLSPNQAALTPDGSLLYVTNRAGSVSVVDTASHQVVAQLALGGDLRSAIGIVATPPGQSGGVHLYVTGYDGSGRPALFVLEAGVLDETAWVDKVPMPVAELPREIEISGDGERVYLTARFLGELWVVDVREQQRGAITRIPLAPGVFDVAEAVADGYLYVSNGFRSEVHVLDLSPGAGRYGLVTTLAAPPSPSVTVAPARGGSGKPEVHRVAPTSGAPAGGDPVVVSGSGFVPGARVLFGGAEAGSVVVDGSGTALSCVTPPSPLPAPGTGAVEIKVENPDGKTGLLQGGFTYAVDTTAPVFTTPPFVASQTLAGDPGAETVTAEVRWWTDEASTSVVDHRPAGASGFVGVVDPALVRLHVVTLTGLAPGSRHELRATSVDAQGNGATSPVPPAVLEFATPSVPDVRAPVIVSGPTVSVTTGSATLQWQTDEHASSAVQYDAQVGDGRLDRQATGAWGTSHTVTLAGLPAGTEHEYRVVSFDASGNGPTRSVLATFRTATLPDTDPPEILAGPAVSYLGNDLVIVAWETDEPSTSFVTYGVHSADEEGVIDLDLVTSHVVFLTDLAPGTAYGYRAGSTDASGNTVLTDDPFAAAAAALGTRTLESDLALRGVTLRAGTRLALRAAAEGFTTAELPDGEPPRLLAATATALSFDRALVAVEVDEAASLRVRYALAGAAALDAEAFEPAFLEAPALVLTGLEGGATYRLALELTDPKGNLAAAELSVTTPAAPDASPPVLTDLAVVEVTASTARVTWRTDEPADASVRFGPAGGSLDGTAGRLGLATSHAVLLTGLAPATPYSFEAAGRDASGNRGTAAGSFTTLVPAPEITSLVPARVTLGESVEVAVNGRHLRQDAQVDFGPGVAVGSVTVSSTGSQLRAAIAVSPAAAVGDRTVTVTTSGGSAAAPFVVVDDTVPVVTVLEPADGAQLSALTVPVRGTVSEPAKVTVNGVVATVTDDASPAFEATVTLPDQGPNRIVVTATDPSGNRGTAVVVVGVEVLDVTPPVLALAATPDVLWPANHKMVPVTIDVQVADDRDPAPEVVLVSVASSEPDDAPGDGDGETVDDVQAAAVGTDDREVLLRAERAGDGPGRVYTLTYRATDATGNTAEASVEVRVPHDRR